MNQTDTETLQRLYAETPSIRIYIDVSKSGDRVVFPPGNTIAMELFSSLMRAALEFDRIEILGEMHLGEFNHGHYVVFVSASAIRMAAIILKGVVEKHLPFASHLVEIVETDDQKSTIVSKIGPGWGELRDRVAWSIGWSERAKNALDEEMPTVQRFCKTSEDLRAELMERLGKLERAIRERRDEGDEWKRQDQDDGENGK